MNSTRWAGQPRWGQNAHTVLGRVAVAFVGFAAGKPEFLFSEPTN